MASPCLTHVHQEAKVSVRVGSSFLTFKAFTWTLVKDLKLQISKLTGIPSSDQRLFVGHIELSNRRTLEDYDLFNRKKTRGLVLECKKIPGSFIRIVPGADCLPSIQEAIQKTDQGLKSNLAPQLTWDGTSGVYLLRDISRNIVAVFKPLDEEAFAPQNPRGYVNQLCSPSFRPGIRSGESAYREVAAFLLDHFGFSGVPATALAESQHPTYKYGLNEQISGKKGSFQLFVNNKGSIEDFSISLFTRFEVQKVAILDLRILNMDRNEANILVTQGPDGLVLVPIDHSLSMPETLEICDNDLCWMNFSQCKEKTDNKCKEFITGLDPLKDISLLKDSMPISDKALMLIRTSTILLQKGTEAGLTLEQIGSLLYRKEDDESPSVIEKVLSKSIELHKSVQKSLKKKPQLKKHNKSTLPFQVVTRARAYSTDTQEELFKAEGEEVQVFVTIKEVENEEEEDLPIIETPFRSHSLPSLDFQDSRHSKESGKAFDSKLFYYIESFIDLAIQSKLKEVNKNTNPNGRPRSVSDAFEFERFHYS